MAKKSTANRIFCHHCQSLNEHRYAHCTVCGERLRHECTAWAIMSPRQRKLHSPTLSPRQPNFFVDKGRFCPVCSAPTTRVHPVRTWIPLNDYVSFEALAKQHIETFGISSSHFK